MKAVGSGVQSQITDCDHDKIHPHRHWQNNQCVWTQVPKNANMMIRKICGKLQMTNTDKPDRTLPERVCVIRNPRTRLISALGEYSKRKKDHRPLRALLEHLCEDATGFDEHLEPQSWYLQEITYTHILKFEQLDTEIYTVPTFAQHRSVVDTVIRPQRLTYSKHHSGDLQDIIEEHQDLVEQCVEKYYALDQDIWQNTDKYQNTE